MQRLLLLLDAVSADTLGCGGGHRVDGVGLGDDVRLVAGRGRELVGRLGEDGSGGGLSGSRGVLDGSGGVLNGRAGLLSRSGGVVLLNGSARSLLGGLLADVALVDGGLLGTSNVLLGH